MTIRDLGRCTFWGSLLGLAIAGAVILSSCATPGPVPPPPPPVPTDVFSGAVIDCASPEVLGGGILRADTAVRACLIGTETSACLAALYPGETLNTIACDVRDNGEVEAYRIRIGQGDANTTTVFNAAKSWLIEHRVGFR
jgi:hypothetical protein